MADIESTCIAREVLEEVDRQVTFGFDDITNTKNDWVAYITGYAGRAANTRKNSREGYEFRRNMIKVAALAISAIKAYDKRCL